MAINTGGGIDSQLRDQTDRFLTNPQAMQGAQQEVQRATRSGIAPDMIDLLSVQAALSAKEAAKEAVEASLNQQPGTIAAQRAEALQAATKDEIVGQVGATLDQRNKQAGQKMAQLQKELGAPAAGPQMASGGIVGYQAGGSAGAVSPEQKATTILKSIGLTPDQYNSMPPEGQQRVLASLKSMGGGAPARPAPQMMGIAQQPAPQMMGIAQQPAPNMARMAGGGIVAFAPGGSVDDPDADYIPDPEYARRLEIRNNMFRAVGLPPEVYDELSVEGRQEISAVINAVETASPENLRETMPRQISDILSREAAALKPPRKGLFGIGLFGSEGGEQAKVDAAYKATGPDAEAKYAEALAAQKENDLRAANLRAAAETASTTSPDIYNRVSVNPLSLVLGPSPVVGSSRPNPNLFTPAAAPTTAAATAAPAAPTAGAPAAAPAAQTPAQIVLGPQGTAGITGAFNPASIPRPAGVGMPKTPLASGAIPAAEKARLAGRLGGIDATAEKLANASGIDAARERAKFVNSPIAFNRQANMDRAQAGIARLQGIRSRQAADVAEYNRNNPFRNFAGLGIGSFAQYGVNQQNQMARNRAAELAEEAEINRRELGITAAELRAGEQAAGAGREAFKDTAAGIRQASANQTSVYNTETNAAKAEAANLLRRSVAALDSEDRALRRALDRGDRIYSADTRLQAAQMAAAAKLAKEQMANIDNERDREEAQRFAVVAARESATKLIAELHNELLLSPAYRNASSKDQEVMWDRASKVGNDMFQVSKDMIISGTRPLLPVNPVTQ
jgi:hypothetical protein